MKRLITEEEQKEKSLTDEEKKLLKFLMDKGLINSASQEKIKQLLGSADTAGEKGAGEEAEGQSPEDNVEINKLYASAIKDLISYIQNGNEGFYLNKQFENYKNFLINKKSFNEEQAKNFIKILIDANAMRIIYLNDDNQYSDDPTVKNDVFKTPCTQTFKEPLEQLLNKYNKTEQTNENKLAKRLKLLANIEK